MGEKKKKTKNTTYEFVCEAHDLAGNQETMAHDYIELLGLTTKYDLDAYDTRLVAEIVYDYLDRNWRW